MIYLICGGQWGSEGKGSFAHWYGRRNHIQIWGRAGGSQAGHSVMLDSGRILRLRQLPVGAVIPGTTSVIGPGAIVDPDLLDREIDEVERSIGEAPSVIVDPLATVLEKDHHPNFEHAQGLVERIGSTGQGVGAARASRIWRVARVMGSVDQGRWILEPAQDFLSEIIGHHRNVLVEGTQGAGLSLFSPWYPYVTSWNTHPGQMLADMGLPLGVTGVAVIGVYRTFPIRVGGNSGPLYRETDWETLQSRYGEHIPIEETTVTGRTRRVGEWDPDLAVWSTRFLAPTEVALTFVDYPFPEIQRQVTGLVPPLVGNFIREKEKDLERSISYIGTGFGTYLSRWEGGW